MEESAKISWCICPLGWVVLVAFLALWRSDAGIRGLLPAGLAEPDYRKSQSESPQWSWAETMEVWEELREGLVPPGSPE